MPELDGDSAADQDGMTEARLALWIEQTRWLYEDVRFRFDSLGRQATALLALSGVLLGLLSAAGIRQSPHPVLFGVAVASDVVSAAVCAWALRPRRVAAVNIRDFRDRWLTAAQETVTGEPARNRDAAPMTEMLLHGAPTSRKNGQGPLQDLAAAAKTRGRLVFSASLLVTLSLVLVGVYVTMGAVK